MTAKIFLDYIAVPVTALTQYTMYYICLTGFHQEFAVPNCVEGATYDPWKTLPEVVTQHNYREGNLPPNSKCAKCRKICSSEVCLTGMRCCWCGMTAHTSCLSSFSEEMQVCRFGVLEPIFLPPTAVSIPRTQISQVNFIGVKTKENIHLYG